METSVRKRYYYPDKTPPTNSLTFNLSPITRNTPDCCLGHLTITISHHSYSVNSITGIGSIIAQPILYETLSFFSRIANPICDELKSDIFSLGLMCLEMASMESLDGVYDWENYVIEEVKVESMILKLKETGSTEPFIEFLLRMLQIEEIDRISLHEIIEYLEPLRPTFSQGAFARFGERSSILSKKIDSFNLPVVLM